MAAGKQAGSPQSAAAGKAQQARNQATQVGHEATHAGSEVAHHAAGQTREVAGEANRQARDLMGEASAQLRQQAQTQQNRVVEGLRGLGHELAEMASRSDQSGMATEMVRRASHSANQAAGWLADREPGTVVDEVRHYARQHPGTFLAVAAVAGALVGRLTRNMSGAGDGTSGPSRAAGRTAPAGPGAGVEGGAHPATPYPTTPGTPHSTTPGTEVPR
ncbi:hypothetical protein GCM10027280_51840 [Micromonospora polyrhachis]|uniref:ElaB/YqjD/DUF883 family membrane-anchored ribosome-binding protein n=1 Tax=Micromonospora polyrhachis TaxID=1282883 RepID=A0A7W7SW42_9ACTN|nr:hypothetical protein [Micromonospora polyrhachis]MBB4962019.1 ElaB/YqjD/DUF883 family membrane-anchored ribosome-binding protein [Micromonospora polyrhachis]